MIVYNGVGGAAMLSSFIVLGIGFASGYGIREWMSRRRRAIERKAYYERHPELRY
jgi:hypothetical protein